MTTHTRTSLGHFHNYLSLDDHSPMILLQSALPHHNTRQAKCIMVQYSIVYIRNYLLPMTTCYHLDTLTPRQSRIFYTASYFDLQQSIHNSSPTKIYEYVPSIQVILSATIFCIFLPASLLSRRRRFDSFPTTLRLLWT